MATIQTVNLTYPRTTIEVLPGDILYSPIGRSTYFVGHSVIVGTDYMVKEVLPGTPAWRSVSLDRLWSRHFPGDKITLLRSPEGAMEAAKWATEHIKAFKVYNLFNYDIHNLTNSYCYKFIAQAYYFGADVDVVRNKHRLLLPNDIKLSAKLNKIAVMEV